MTGVLIYWVFDCVIFLYKVEQENNNETLQVGASCPIWVSILYVPPLNRDGFN